MNQSDQIAAFEAGIPIHWTPIPEGEGDGSVECVHVDGEYPGAYERQVRVILGGNDLWTTYIHIRRRLRVKQCKNNCRGRGGWIGETVMHELRRPQFVERGHAIAWAEEKWTEALIRFPLPVISPEI